MSTSIICRSSPSEYRCMYVPSMPIKGRAICDHARRGSRSCPFATLIGASERAQKVRQNAPISVSNGHDLTLLPSSPTFEQKVCSPEISQFGKHKVLTLWKLVCGNLDGVFSFWFALKIQPSFHSRFQPNFPAPPQLHFPSSFHSASGSEVTLCCKTKSTYRYIVFSHYT